MNDVQETRLFLKLQLHHGRAAISTGILVGNPDCGSLLAAAFAVGIITPPDQDRFAAVPCLPYPYKRMWPRSFPGEFTCGLILEFSLALIFVVLMGVQPTPTPPMTGKVFSQIGLSFALVYARL